MTELDGQKIIFCRECDSLAESMGLEISIRDNPDKAYYGRITLGYKGGSKDLYSSWDLSSVYTFLKGRASMMEDK